MIHRTAEH